MTKQGSVLGPHCLSVNDGALRMVRAGARVVKLLVDGAGSMAAEIRRLSPNITIIGRAWVGFDVMREWYEQGIEAEHAAQAWMAQQLPRMRPYPDVDLWEGPNEPNVSDAARMKWYGLFEAERVRLMAAAGLRCIVGNFSVGTPEIDLWPLFFPALIEAKKHGGACGFHEYGWPTLYRWVADAPDDGHAPATVSGEGWLVMRYRKALAVFRPAGLNIPVVITECGVDPAIGQKPFRGEGAWRDAALRDMVWRDRFGQRDPNRFYAEQFQWYDRELRKDPEVIGALPFTFGNDGHWGNYQVDDTPLLEILCSHLEKELEVMPPTPLPQPVPPAKALPPWAQIIILSSTDEQQQQATGLVNHILDLAGQGRPISVMVLGKPAAPPTPTVATFGVTTLLSVNVRNAASIDPRAVAVLAPAGKTLNGIEVVKDAQGLTWYRCEVYLRADPKLTRSIPPQAV